MARALYSLLFYLATPLLLGRLLWRSLRQPAYRQHLGERWGFYPQAPTSPAHQPPPIWVHAVSVGETRAVQPLMEGIQAQWPGQPILLTCSTPTGRETGALLFGPSVQQCYLPYDQPGAVHRFLAHHRPCLGLLMETELWPNLLATARARNIPMLLANARLSERSARGYARLAPLVRPMLEGLSAIAAQTEADALRFRTLAEVQPLVCGNLKFEVHPKPELLALGQSWRDALGPRPIWLAASTREGEEALILDAWAKHPNPDNALLVLVPRHPQRFSEVATLIRARGFHLHRRSETLPAPDTQVWLGDSMGEMAAYYRLAEVAFIGGSLMPLGGQNLIEAAACDCPVLIGPSTFNFAQASADALACGAACQVASAEDLIRTVNTLLTSPEQRAAMRTAARQFAQAHGGASAKILTLLTALRPPASR